MLYDDGTHGDADADDGVYTSLFSETEIPGSYTFHFVGSDIPCGEGFVTTREWTKSLYNEVAIDPDYSDISIQRSGTTAERDPAGGDACGGRGIAAPCHTRGSAADCAADRIHTTEPRTVRPGRGGQEGSDRERHGLAVAFPG